MKLVYHSEEKMFTCFGTRAEHTDQEDWYNELPDDCHLVVGSWEPFAPGKVLWHVWDEWEETDSLILWKLTWGGA